MKQLCLHIHRVMFLLIVYCITDSNFCLPNFTKIFTIPLFTIVYAKVFFAPSLLFLIFTLDLGSFVSFLV